jgi:acylphosphatase
MKQCLKVTLHCGKEGDFLTKFLKTCAQKSDVEGVAQRADTNQVVMHVCGKSDGIDTFVDAIHESSTKYNLTDIMLEPFFKTRDYRGVFRVIE